MLYEPLLLASGRQFTFLTVFSLSIPAPPNESGTTFSRVHVYALIHDLHFLSDLFHSVRQTLGDFVSLANDLNSLIFTAE